MHRLFMARGSLIFLAWRLPAWLSGQPHPVEVMSLLLLIGPISGIITSYLYASLVKTFGHLMGAKHLNNNLVRITLAWSYLPFILGLITYIFSYLILFSVFENQEGFVGEVYGFHPLGWLPIILLSCFTLFGIYNLIRAMGATMRLPSGKTALNLLLSQLSLYIPLALAIAVYTLIAQISISALMTP